MSHNPRKLRACSLINSWSPKSASSGFYGYSSQTPGWSWVLNLRYLITARASSGATCYNNDLIRSISLRLTTSRVFGWREISGTFFPIHLLPDVVSMADQSKNSRRSYIADYQKRFLRQLCVKSEIIVAEVNQPAITFYPLPAEF